MAVTKQDVACELLRATSVEVLRTAVRSKREWAAIYKGFRPQFLTRAMFLRGATQFARNLPMLQALCDTFLDSLSVAPGPDLKQRFAAAVESSRLEDSIREMCDALAKMDLAELPSTPDLGNLDNPVTGFAAPGPGNAIPLAAMSHENGNAEPVSPSWQDDGSNGIDGDSGMLPDCVTEQTMLVWEPPTDHVVEVQQAVTLLERTLVAFVARQLEAFHGVAWLRKGCGPWKARWREKADRSKAVEPKTLLGFAELGELLDVIKANWKAFERYFPSKEYLERSFSNIIALRVSGAHPGQREIYLIEQVAALSDMVKLAKAFHKPTADQIDELFQKVVRAETVESPPDTTLCRVQTNLGDTPNLQLVGREQELRRLQEFWNDEFARVLSITGAGGVGKTALLDGFIYRLLESPCPTSKRPDPEVLVYLTAKDNYLRFMPKSSPSKKFGTLDRIYEATLELIEGEAQISLTKEDKRASVLRWAKSVRILFALDNLESLSSVEFEAVSGFLDDLQPPSKAIVTTRINRRVGSRQVQLDGLPPAEARELLLSRLESFGIEPEADELGTLDELVRYTNGFPLALIYCANAVANGHTIKDTVFQLRGKGFLDLLSFSFESSLGQLEEEALWVLCFLALSKIPRGRKHILPLLRDGEQLDEVLGVLQAMSFVKRTSEEGKKIVFSVDNPQLSDYVLKRAPEILPPGVFANVRKMANVLPAAAESPSVLIEVKKAIDRSLEQRSRGWGDPIRELETARDKWGEYPILLAQLGYYYYRDQNLGKARNLLEKAIREGHESPDTFLHLALVLYYDHEYDSALAHAETALALRSPFPKAEQIAAECLFEKAKRGTFTLGDEARLKMQQRALVHLKKSLIADERNRGEEEHNRFSRRLIDQVEEQIARLDSFTA